jgi:hypothetical protein
MQEAFDICFRNQYTVIHRLETNKLRNTASLFAHLLATDALPWSVLSCIRITEEDTTSASRIFVKYLFQVGQGQGHVIRCHSSAVHYILVPGTGCMKNYLRDASIGMVQTARFSAKVSVPEMMPAWYCTLLPSLLQELSSTMGVLKLAERINDPMTQEWYDNIFPKDTQVGRTGGLGSCGHLREAVGCFDRCLTTAPCPGKGVMGNRDSHPHQAMSATCYIIHFSSILSHSLRPSGSPALLHQLLHLYWSGRPHRQDACLLCR